MPIRWRWRGGEQTRDRRQDTPPAVGSVRRPAAVEPSTQPNRSELKAQPRAQVVQNEIAAEEGPGAGDDGDVEAEEQAAKRGSGGEKDDVSKAGAIGHKRVRQR